MQATVQSIAIIFPLHDERGMARKAVAAWKKQCQDDPTCHIVVVGKKHGRLSAAIQKQLGTQGRFVFCDSRNEAEIYNAGVQATDAKWLLFTESHVLPTDETVSKLKCRLRETSAGAAVLGSTHLARSRFSAVDGALHTRESPSMQSLGLWRCVGLRGFVVRRDIFKQLGCFNTRYFRFAETAFAIHLTQSGHELVSFDDVIVCHVDSDSLAEIFFAMKFGRLGACRFHQEEPVLARQAFGCPIATTPSATVSLPLARSLWGEPVRALQKGRPLAACRLIRLALPAAWTALAGSWATSIQTAWRCGSAFSRFLIMLHGTHRHFPPTHSRLVDQYIRLREASADFGAVLFQRERASANQTATPLDPGSIQATDCGQHAIGFYGPERWNNNVFCWSAPRAGIQLHLPAGEHLLELDIRPTGRLTPRKLTFFLDGEKLPETAWHEQNGFVRVHVNMNGTCQNKVVLSWTCRAFRPARSGLADNRCLGLALISASLCGKGQPLPTATDRKVA